MPSLFALLRQMDKVSGTFLKMQMYHCTTVPPPFFSFSALILWRIHLFILSLHSYLR